MWMEVLYISFRLGLWRGKYMQSLGYFYVSTPQKEIAQPIDDGRAFSGKKPGSLTRHAAQLRVGEKSASAELSHWSVELRYGSQH